MPVTKGSTGIRRVFATHQGRKYLEERAMRERQRAAKKQTDDAQKRARKQKSKSPKGKK